MSEYLDGAEKQNALDFAAYCRANKMTPQWQSTNRWRFQHKGKRVCIVRLWDDSWSIMPYNAMGPWPEFSAEWEKFIFDAVSVSFCSNSSSEEPESSFST